MRRSPVRAGFFASLRMTVLRKQLTTASASLPAVSVGCAGSSVPDFSDPQSRKTIAVEDEGERDEEKDARQDHLQRGVLLVASRCASSTGQKAKQRRELDDRVEGDGDVSLTGSPQYPPTTVAVRAGGCPFPAARRSTIFLAVVPRAARGWAMNTAWKRPKNASPTQETDEEEGFDEMSRQRHKEAVRKNVEHAAGRIACRFSTNPLGVFHGGPAPERQSFMCRLIVTTAR